MNLNEMKDKGLAAEWHTEESLQMLNGGYLLPEEYPIDAYRRVASTLANVLKKPEMEKPFFDIMWKNWLCPASPVLSSLGTPNFPISCFSGSTYDSTYGYMQHATEMAMLTKRGGGVGSYLGNMRPSGSRISSGGVSDGVLPFAKIMESVIEGIKQGGGKRRGSVAQYLPFNHGDIDSFIEIRKPTGDLSRRCLAVSYHNGVCISDEDMHDIISGNKIKRDRWNKLLSMRVETGEPYIIFTDNANKNCPEEYKGRITHSNLCSEIMAPVTPEETFVCCLSSLNLARHDEWKNWKCPYTGLSLVELSIYMLDAVLSVFIKQAKDVEGFDNSVRFAENHRMLGLGVLGWHTLLQSKMIPFESFESMTLNNSIFKQIREQSDRATLLLAKEYGECKETKGTGRRNTATLAIAPTMSNSVLSGGISQGIEPLTANLFVQKAAKGTFIKHNPQLLTLLQQKGLDTSDIWNQINLDSGSVRNIKQLSPLEKEVFLTAREISQYALVQQAAQRQKYIDQGQSLNLFFSLPEKDSDKKRVAKYMNDVHLEAWKLGVKSLYYLKTASPIKGASLFKEQSDCKSCEG